jgi:hypothetical protein
MGSNAFHLTGAGTSEVEQFLSDDLTCSGRTIDVSPFIPLLHAVLKLG